MALWEALGALLESAAPRTAGRRTCPCGTARAATGPVDATHAHHAAGTRRDHLLRRADASRDLNIDAELTNRARRRCGSDGAAGREEKEEGRQEPLREEAVEEEEEQGMSG